MNRVAVYDASLLDTLRDRWDLVFVILCLCAVFFTFLSTPVPEVTGVGHSGRYAETRQYKLLEDYPEDQKPD